MPLEWDCVRGLNLGENLNWEGSNPSEACVVIHQMLAYLVLHVTVCATLKDFDGGPLPYCLAVQW